ncbi:MAG: AHH domain-containing protein, partial [Fimbriiglobus sp.]
VVQKTPAGSWQAIFKSYEEARDACRAVGIEPAPPTAETQLARVTVKRVNPPAVPGQGTLKPKYETLAKNLGGRRDGFTPHHLIPVGVAKDSPVMKRAAELGYDINRGTNGVMLPNTPDGAKQFYLPYHRGRHGDIYTGPGGANKVGQVTLVKDGAVRVLNPGETKVVDGLIRTYRNGSTQFPNLHPVPAAPRPPLPRPHPNPNLQPITNVTPPPPPPGRPGPVPQPVAVRPPEPPAPTVPPPPAAPPAKVTIKGETGFTGTLRGQPVTLAGVPTETITFTKIDKATQDVRRAVFESTDRGDFLKGLANNPEKVAALKKAGLTDELIAGMRNGELPITSGYQVHHKIPIAGGGTNLPDNLVIIKNDPYHLTITNYQNSVTGGMAAGEAAQLPWPIVPGFIYPP